MRRREQERGRHLDDGHRGFGRLDHARWHAASGARRRRQGRDVRPGRGSSFVDTSRQYNIYDPLVRVGPDLKATPGLALEWTPNADATIWEVGLRPGVTFHDGKPFTAADVIYTLRSMGDPKHVAHSSVTNIRLAELKRVNALTVRIPLKSADVHLPQSFVNGNTVVIQNGTTSFAKPVGTGPFVFESFKVGERSRALANKDYWETGKPYVDVWEDVSIDDPAARVNALLSGEIDAMSVIDFTQAKAHKAAGDLQIIDATSPSIQVIYMAVNRPPFTDNRVREAFRLIADRQALSTVRSPASGHRATTSSARGTTTSPTTSPSASRTSRRPSRYSRRRARRTSR